MDRRRRSSSSTTSPSKQYSRRQRQLILPRLLSAKTTTYAIITLIFLCITFIFIALLEEQPDDRVIYPTLQATSQKLQYHRKSVSQFAVCGSTKQLRILLDNITKTSMSKSSQSKQTPIVVTIAVNYAYRELALNFICNLKRLKILNYIVLAMDRAVYDYLSVRGAHVFFYQPSTGLPISHRRLQYVDNKNHETNTHVQDGALFGSTAFVETSRRKSMLVLKVLRLGYSVIFSDVDVVWVKNPIPFLVGYKSDFVIQSDRMYKDRDAPLNYNLNSGFYFARSNPKTVTVLQAIIKYAKAIRRSEQKAFNFVLCGAFKELHAGPGLRVGSNECVYTKNEARALALPLDQFPNGSDQRFNNMSASVTKLYPEVVAVHTNYISGQIKKVERIQSLGFWFHSTDSTQIDECVYHSIER